MGSVLPLFQDEKPPPSNNVPVLDMKHLLDNEKQWNLEGDIQMVESKRESYHQFLDDYPEDHGGPYDLGLLVDLYQYALELRFKCLVREGRIRREDVLKLIKEDLQK